jgi:hypothetical protein
LENGRYEVNSNDDFIDKGNELISMINKYNEGNTIA